MDVFEKRVLEPISNGTTGTRVTKAIDVIYKGRDACASARRLTLDWLHFREAVYETNVLLEEYNEDFLLDLARKDLETCQRLQSSPCAIAVSPGIQRENVHSVRLGTQSGSASARSMYDLRRNWQSRRTTTAEIM